MKAPDFWYPNNGQKSFLAYILTPISQLIYFFAKYRFKNRVGYAGKTPIICIGNVTAGGTGKTPTAMMIAQLITQMNLRPVFLTKGYGGTIIGPYMVQPTDKAHATGDEPLILMHHAPVIIAKDRIAGAHYIDQLQQYDVIITDDGLQNHPDLYKNCAIMTVDATRLFGNHSLIPAGPLREPVKAALAEVDAVIMIGQHPFDRTKLPDILGTTTKPVIQALKVPVQHGADLQGENVVVFSALGHNEQFQHAIKNAGAHIIHAQAFPDHFEYNNIIIERLIKTAQTHAALLVTSEKDMVKINPKYYPYLVPFLISLDICDSDINLLQEIILKKTGIVSC